MKKDIIKRSYFFSKNSKTVMILSLMLIFMLTFAGCAKDGKEEANSETQEQTDSADAEKTVYVVAKDGSGDFTTIHEALANIPASYDKRIKIFIKNGTYDEDLITISEMKNNLTLEGESRDGVLITRAEGVPNSNTVNVTMEVNAQNFVAVNLTIENRVPYSNAVKVSGDKAIFKNCCLVGGQDTLYLSKDGARQYFEDCIIKGYTDFIYGPSTAVFKNCEIITYRRSGYITAASTNPGNKYGLIFMNCNIKSESSEYKTHLGRPWRQGAAVVFMNCYLGDHVLTEGWTDMHENKAELARFYEYKNTGPGAVINEKRRQLTDEEAKEYTLEKIFKNSKDTWDPLTVEY